MSVHLFNTVEIENLEEITKEIKIYADGFMDVAKNFYQLDQHDFLKKCPLIKSWISSQGLELQDSILVVIAPKKLNPNIHIDTIPKYGLQRTSLNIPIQGCSNSETRIYELVKGATVYKTTIDGSDYIAFTPDAEFKKIGSYQLHKPTALNIVNPHGIINLSDEVRISLSLRFVLEPSWLYE